MTPIRPLPSPSILPGRLHAGDRLLTHRYIIARILELQPGQLSATHHDGVGIPARLQSLSEETRRHIETNSGAALHALTSIAEEPNPEFFYEALYRSGRQAENEDHFEVAERCYFFLSTWDGNGSPVPSRLREQARARLEVLAGGGSTGDRLEFGLRRLPAQSFDPAFLIGMGAASVAARGLRLGLLARTARSGTAAPRFFPRLFEAGLMASAESLFFVGAERSAAAALGIHRRESSAPEEWLRYALPMFFATRLFGTASSQLYRRRLSGGSLRGAPFRHRLGYGLFTQSSILGAAYFAQNLESSEAAAERRPADAIAQALIWTLSFSTFNSLSRRVGGSRVR